LVGAVDVQRQRADGVQVEDVDAVGFQARGALLGTGYRAFDAILDPRERVDEIRDRGAGAHPHHHAVLDVVDGLLARQALGIAHCSRPSRDSRIFHCAAVTGSTDSRAPLRIRAKSSPSCSLRVRIRDSGTGFSSLRTKPTSTSIQRGSSRVALGSKYLDLRSNWVGSG